MDRVPDDQATLVIKVVEFNWLASRRSKVFVDNEVVGTLEGGRTPSFPITAGVHRVSIKNCFFWSETVELSCAPRERVVLRCGMPVGAGKRAVWPLLLIMYLPILCLPIMIALDLRVIYSVSAASIFLLTAFFWSTWQWMIGPGRFFSLKTLVAPDAQDVAKNTPWRVPRISIRYAMIVVAALAVVLAIGVAEWKGQRRRDYQTKAERHAHEEQSCKSYLDREFLPKARRVTYKRRAEYHARMKQKYLEAATDPWARVEEEPEPP